MRTVLCSLLLALATTGAIRAADIGTAFTYQGNLVKSGTPVTDTCDFRIGLWNAAAGGNQVGNSPQTVSGLGVADGVFTATIDFGASAINGEARWLEIEVQCGVIPTFFLLSPRVELKPAPHALALPGLYTQQNATSPNLIGGYSGNTVTAGIHGATISGGGQFGAVNSVASNYGTVGGGLVNEAIADYSTVGGGQGNTASNSWATIAGGLNNTASHNDSTVGGGAVNNASGIGSTVSGGVMNNASEIYSTVPGGSLNQAGGRHSFAAGRQAKVRTAAEVGGGDVNGDEGTFIWADNTAADFTSTGPNQFLIRATGGVGIGTNSPTEELDVAGDIHASGTIASGSSITIDGTAHTIVSDADLELHVADGRAVLIESHPTAPNMIGGHSSNMVSPGVFGATIGGGGRAVANNRITEYFGTIGGGYGNIIGNDAEPLTDGERSTIGGGVNNRTWGFESTIGGGAANVAFGQRSTVAGGTDNAAESDYSSIGGGTTNRAFGFAVVGGGSQNIAGGFYSTVGGGDRNQAGGQYATVPGGRSNSAGGHYSFAVGRRAKADQDGSFVWGDSADADLTSSAPDQFLARASGGTTIYSNAALTAGVTLAAGGSAWAAVSDKNLKENFAEVDKVALLEGLAAIQITTWNYKSQDDSIRHIGPMGQDFRTAFGVGEEETRITTIDADGVALAAIQGLYEVVKEKECEIEELRQQKDREIAELREQMTRLETLVGTLAVQNMGGGR